MEKEYIRIGGVEFHQTLSAPLNHVDIHPLLLGDLLNGIPDSDQWDILVHKAVLPEITMEQKIDELAKKYKENRNVKDQ